MTTTSERTEEAIDSLMKSILADALDGWAEQALSAVCGDFHNGVWDADRLAAPYKAITEALGGSEANAAHLIAYLCAWAIANGKITATYTVDRGENTEDHNVDAGELYIEGSVGAVGGLWLEAMTWDEEATE